MRSLKLGFALEGNSDYPVIPCLTRRLIAERFPQIALDEDSIRRPRKRGHGFISELPTFARQLCDDGVDILVAVVDTDNTLLSERRDLLKAAKERCRDWQIAICIAEGLAVRALEAWLLADEAAIFGVFDGDKKKVIHFPAPEKEPDPKSALNRIVRTLTKGREVTFASFSQELAEAIRLSLLCQRCPQFNEFAKHLLDCIKEWQRIVVRSSGK